MLSHVDRSLRRGDFNLKGPGKPVGAPAHLGNIALCQREIPVLVPLGSLRGGAVCVPPNIGIDAEVAYVRYRTYESPDPAYTPGSALCGATRAVTPWKSAMPARSLPKENHLLAALPGDEWERWLPQLEWVDMPLGEVIYESGDTLSHVYFPTTAIVSLLYVMENGGSAEIAVVGNEGIVGISLFMGGESTPSRAVVQSAGQGFRLTAGVIKDEFKRAPVLHLLLRYTQALITQMAQTAVCNRHHSLDQQLCRWLLLSLDRLKGLELVMTQELISNMLGVRREGVTEAALKLQKAGLIRYSRGRIAVLDRPGIEARCCECYVVVKREYDRLLPATQAI
jgi:CRP-like cAMP-binding protein